jgi:hypothetical protein
MISLINYHLVRLFFSFFFGDLVPLLFNGSAFNLDVHDDDGNSVYLPSLRFASIFTSVPICF